MDLLAGRYRLVEQLGEGGGGTVWRAVDELLRREVAVKQVRIPPGLQEAERAEFTGRAIQEARAAGRLSHPSIVMIHDVVEHAGQPWIVMDLVPGRSLDKVIREDGPLPVQRVAEIGLSVLDALQAAHAHGILHRDVKPGNVLIAADGRAMLTDFGIAAPLAAGAASPGFASPDAGPRGSIAGSPAYMAPERFRGEPDGPPSDLWSLGATLYTAVEGRPPFQRDLAAALVAAVLLHEPQPMVRASAELAWLVHGLLDKDPARRPPPQVVRQVLHALAGSAEVQPGRAARPGRILRFSVGAALVVALGVAAGFGAWRLAAGEPGNAGRFTVAPDPCQSLTNTALRELLGGKADRRPLDSGCQWQAYVGEGRRTITVTYRVAEGEAADVAAVAREFAGQREALPGTVLSVDLADEAFSRAESDPDAGTAGTTVWFRLSNLIAEVAYRRTGDAAVTEDDRQIAVRAAELVKIGLG